MTGIEKQMKRRKMDRTAFRKAVMDVAIPQQLYPATSLIYGWIDGTYKPSGTYIPIIAKALNCTADEILA